MANIWEGLKKGIGAVAPVLANAIVPGSGGLAATLVGQALGVDPDDPEAMSAAVAAATPEQRAALRRVETEHKERLAQIAAERDIAELKAGSERIESVNQTMRSEAAIGHKWSGMWRPFWGFVSAAAFALAVLGIIVWGVVAAAKGNFGELVENLPNIIFALSALFAVPMTILGVASHHRGREKRVQAGEPPAPGLIGQIAGAFGKGR